MAGGGVAAITGGNDSNGNAHTNYFSADDDSPLVNGNALNFDLPDLSTPSVGEVATGDAIASQFTTDDGWNTPALMGDLTIKTGTFNGAVSMEDNKRNAVSASLMGNAIIGEYITSGTYATDWVVTFPTRYLHVNTDTNTNVISAPFTTVETAASDQACLDVDFDFWNREGALNSIDTDTSGGLGFPYSEAALCYEVNVLSLNDANSVSSPSEALGSITNKTVFPLGTNFADGWVWQGFGAYILSSDDLDPVFFIGLPTVGFSAVAGLERGSVFASRVSCHQTSN